MKLFVDSLSLAIPLHLVTVRNGTLISKIKLSECDSVIVADGSDNPNSKAAIFDDNPRIQPDLEMPICEGEDLGSVYYKVRHRKCGKDWVSCMMLSINSKMLTDDYYKGITGDTIKDLHWFILSQNVISVSLSDFREGLVSDVDISHDFYDQMDIKSVSNDFKQTLRTEHKTRFKMFKKGATGFSCGKRGDKYPEFKLYDKLADMTAPTGKHGDIKRKLAYTNKYLPGASHPVARLEVTFSNVHDMRMTGLLGKKDTNTLDTIVKSLENEKAQQAMGYRAKQYFNTTVVGSKDLDASSIAGVLPSKSIRAKLEGLSNLYNRRRAPLEHVIETMLIMIHKDNYKWAKGYLKLNHWTVADMEPNPLHKLLSSGEIKVHIK